MNTEDRRGLDRSMDHCDLCGRLRYLYTVVPAGPPDGTKAREEWLDVLEYGDWMETRIINHAELCLDCIREEMIEEDGAPVPITKTDTFWRWVYYKRRRR